MDDDAHIPASQPAHRLRSAREFRGLNQAELSAKAGIASSSVCRIEKFTGLPSTLTLVRIADALDVSTDYLLGRADNPAMADATARLDSDVGSLSVSNRKIVANLVVSLHAAERHNARRAR